VRVFFWMLSSFLLPTLLTAFFSRRGTPVLGKLADSVVLSAVRAATGGRCVLFFSSVSFYSTWLRAFYFCSSGFLYSFYLDSYPRISPPHVRSSIFTHPHFLLHS
jgi:hypothetical protein